MMQSATFVLFSFLVHQIPQVRFIPGCSGKFLQTFNSLFFITLLLSCQFSLLSNQNIVNIHSSAVISQNISLEYLQSSSMFDDFSRYKFGLLAYLSFFLSFPLLYINSFLQSLDFQTVCLICYSEHNTLFLKLNFLYLK